MAQQISEDALISIENAVRKHPEGAAAPEIMRTLGATIPLRTLQYRLKFLVENDRLVMEGSGRWAKYRAIEDIDAQSQNAAKQQDHFGSIIPVSEDAQSVLAYVCQEPEARKPVGYDRGFLDAYQPNTSYYLTEEERARLAKLGNPSAATQPAGTYAKLILNRLLIDLAWNSSRLEGNTYSMLDTKRLIEFGEEATGRDQVETQMILNHKDAIEFLVGSADDIGFNNYTVLNLHALLANNLLADPAAVGRLRHIAVGIERSAFHPLEVPQQIREGFQQILATAEAISDPFEQAFFVMVHLPYLQPFDDVNKRVSRLAANIPLIKHNFSPLSFADVPQRAYTEAILGVYELNQVSLLKDVFLWAYERSAARYIAVRQSLGEPDPLRLRYREQLQEVVSELIRGKVNRKDVTHRILAWATQRIESDHRDAFIEAVEVELTGLHEGNFARYKVRPSEFRQWQETWKGA